MKGWHKDVQSFDFSAYIQCWSVFRENQDLQDMEVLCLNDGSTDNSGIIAHEYERKDGRFKVVDKENSGYGKTMNVGLDLAKGKYVGIVESDDFIEPAMFSELYRIAEEYQADVVKSAFWIYANGYDAYYDVIGESFYNKSLCADDTSTIFDRNPSIWSNLYNREFLNSNRIRFLESPGASFQDTAWRVKVFASAAKAVFVKKAYYHYRRDNINASVRDDGKLFCVCDEYDEAERFLAKRIDWDDKYQYLLPYLRWGHYVWNCFDRWLSIGGRWKFYKRMCEEFMKCDNEGMLRRSFWREPSWFALQNMLWNRRQFFFDRCAEFWRKSIMLSGFLPMLSECKNIAIYGAGKVGREALAALCLYGMRPECFVVSDMSGNENSVEDVPVRVIDELLPVQDEYVILIAVGYAAQPEILELLLEKGFQYIVGFLPEVRQALR